MLNKYSFCWTSAHAKKKKKDIFCRHVGRAQRNTRRQHMYKTETNVWGITVYKQATCAGHSKYQDIQEGIRVRTFTDMMSIF